MSSATVGLSKNIPAQPLRLVFRVQDTDTGVPWMVNVSGEAFRFLRGGQCGQAQPQAAVIINSGLHQ